MSAIIERVLSQFGVNDEDKTKILETEITDQDMRVLVGPQGFREVAGGGLENYSILLAFATKIKEILPENHKEFFNELTKAISAVESGGGGKRKYKKRKSKSKQSRKSKSKQSRKSKKRKSRKRSKTRRRRR